MSLLEQVDLRTQMVGENRLELLLFRLKSQQLFGINVFKVREVMPCPRLTRLPHSQKNVVGVAHIRGQAVTVIDLNFAIGRSQQSLDDAFVIITEYNRSVQGFLVRGVDRIVNINWEAVSPPPQGVGNKNYLTAVTEVDDQLVEIIDIEQILVLSNPELAPESVAPSLERHVPVREKASRKVLVIDDSALARKQILKVIEAIGLEAETKNNGREALDHIKALAESGVSVKDEYPMIICDIEMPMMDGYTFTAEVRKDPALADVYVMLHTSLSGVFNESMVKKAGADDFLAKFCQNELSDRVYASMAPKT